MVDVLVIIETINENELYKGYWPMIPNVGDIVKTSRGDWYKVIERTWYPIDGAETVRVTVVETA